MELQISTQNLNAHESQFLQRFLAEKISHLEHFFDRESLREGMIVRARLEFLPHRKSYRLHLKTHLRNRDVEYTQEGHELSPLLKDGWKRFERSVVEEWKAVRKRWSIARHHELSEEERHLKRLLGEKEVVSSETILSRIQEELSSLWHDLSDHTLHEIRFREYVGELPRGLLEPQEVLHQAVVRILEEIRRGGETPADLRAYLLRFIRLTIEEEILRRGIPELLPASREEGETEEDLEILPEILQKEVEQYPEREKGFLKIFSELPPRDRALVRLYMDRDRTLSDLATIYGVPLSQIEGVVARVNSLLDDVRRKEGLVSS
jgi:DNA-directed RNA polymerase specialized sigma24 family protein